MSASTSSASAATTTTSSSTGISTSKNDISAKVLMIQSIVAVLLLQALYKIAYEAYDIRLYAIKEFGRVIHEFDPYFNYRATEVCFICLFLFFITNNNPKTKKQTKNLLFYKMFWFSYI